MGDLGNAVPYANNAPAGDRFNVSCNFDPSRMDNELKIARYDEHDIYISVPENCQVAYSGKPILGIKMDVNLVVRLVTLHPFRSLPTRACKPSCNPQVSSEPLIRALTPTTKLIAYSSRNTQLVRS
jgi:hypothetical protein